MMRPASHYPSVHVLLTGATGFIGRHLLPELLERGHEVTALVRDRTGADFPAAVRVIEGDLQQPESVSIVGNPGEDAGGDRETTFAEAIEDCDVAYDFIHSMRAGEDFERLDRTLARNFADAATTAGIDRVIYLGGLGEGGATGDDSGDGDDPADSTATSGDAPLDDLSPHLRSRREVEAILANGGYELTTLRAAIVIGPGSDGFEIVRQLATKLPIMVTPSWVRTPCQPIAIDDAVAYLAGVLEAPETAGKTYGIGGPEVLSYQAMLKRVGAILGSEPLIVPVPVLSPKLSSYWVGLVTDVDASIARPLIEGLRTPVVVEDPAIDEHVSVEHTSFDEAVRRALEGDRR